MREGMMEKGNKASIIAQIWERQDSELFRLFIALTDALIDEQREKIDTAPVTDIQNIQGRIVQLKYLKDTFTKKPIIQKQEG
jgi:hypothetical protein